MADIQQLLQELIGELRRVDLHAAQSLLPGQPADVVRNKFATLPYSISPDAAVLYSTVDANPSFRAPFEMLPGGYLVPFDKAFAEFEILHGIRDELLAIFPEPYIDCFRFLTDKSDGGYAFGRVDSPSHGQIVSLEIHAPNLIGFRDLEHLLKTSIECHREGIMRAFAGEPDFDAYFALAARMNPGMKAWEPRTY